ncbi:unnamed protein product [Laminaria digitata]
MCAGACVCWFSRAQKCVTLSTTEAEYVALADPINKEIFMRYVWSFIFPGSDATCVSFFEDNERGQGTWPETQCVRRTGSTSTYDTTSFRELSFRMGCTSTQIKSEEQHADLLTKPLSVGTFRYHRDFLINI